MTKVRFSPSQIAAVADWFEFADAATKAARARGRNVATQGENDQAAAMMARCDDKFRDYAWNNCSEVAALVTKEITRRRNERIQNFREGVRRQQRRAAAARDLALAFA